MAVAKAKQRFCTSQRYCVPSNGPRTVTVTVPDGDVETFQAKAYPECSDMVATLDVELRFEPVGDTQSTLRQDDHSNVRIGDIVGQPNAYLFDLGNPDVPVDPSHYTLTTADGMVYTLDQGFGLQKITDPSGNSQSHSASGIVHTGTAVGFTRDTLGRITRITCRTRPISNTSTTPTAIWSAMATLSRHLTPDNPVRAGYLLPPAFTAAMNCATRWSSSGSGTEPMDSTASWKARRSNLGPSSASALARSSRMRSSPSL